jgi:hypothetical protein
MPAIYVSSYCCICVSSYSCICVLFFSLPPKNIDDFEAEVEVHACYICVLVLLYVWPTTKYVSSYYYMCVLIPHYMCPHTTLCVSAYYYLCVLIPLYMCPHTTLYVSSFYYICVLILLCMCLHTTIHVAAYHYMFVCLHTNIYICVLIQRAASQFTAALLRLYYCFTNIYMCPHTARS